MVQFSFNNFNSSNTRQYKNAYVQFSLERFFSNFIFFTKNCRESGLSFSMRDNLEYVKVSSKFIPGNFQAMQKKFETILRQLITTGEGEGPLTGIEIAEQFRPDEVAPESALRNLNAAFLISLCGRFHPFCFEAEQFIEHLKAQPALKESVEFYEKSRSLILAEIKERFNKENEFQEDVNNLFEWIKNPRNLTNRTETMKKVWTVFFPEGVPSLADRKDHIRGLRQKRSVRITRLNPQPIKDPANEILFTSNVLLTVPSSTGHIDELALPKNVKSRLGETIQETQRYWYDHPIQIGVEAEKNEIVYGLRGLDEAIAFEKERGVIEKDVKVRGVLSVSVTHEGLHELAKPYLEAVLKRTRGIHHLRVCIMTDSDVSRLGSMTSSARRPRISWAE